MSLPHAFAQAATLLLLVLLLPLARSHDAQPTTVITAELNDVLAKIQAKLDSGQQSERALTPEIEELDVLLTKYKPRQSDEVLHILVAKITLYLGVLNDVEKSSSLLRQLQAEFPESDAARDVEGLRTALLVRSRLQSARQALVGHLAPPLSFPWSSRAGLTSLGKLKGKVVLLFFWATWSLPSENSFGLLREIAEHYRGRSVEIVGVTSLQGSVSGLSELPIDTTGKPAEEWRLMSNYIRAKAITWPVVFCEESAFMAGYSIAEIPSMTLLAPDGTVHHTGLNPSLPASELIAKIDALLAKTKG